MKKWFAIMLLLSLTLFGSVIGFNIFKQKMIAEYMANMPEPEFPVTATTIVTEDWTPTINAIGFIEPKQGVTLTSQSSGIIDKISFESGQSVKKGQALLTLDSKVEKANLASAQARLPAALATFKRTRDLYRTKAVSKESLDQADANYRSLLAEITSLEAAIERRTITAPFSGIVGIRNVYLGQYVQPGTEIVRLEDIATMRFRFTVPQRDIEKISLGQMVDIKVDSYPNKPFMGKIVAIEPAVNYQSGLIQVQADIPNNHSELRSGMFARASVLLPKITEQIVVPQTALSYTLYGTTIYLLKPDENGALRAHQQVVTTAEQKGDKVHITEGLTAGDTIVTSGQIRLSNLSKVKQVTNDALNTPQQTPKL